MASIEFNVDRERRILIISYIGDVTGSMVLGQTPPIWRLHPEVVVCDCIIDATHATGPVSWDVIKEVAAQWREFSRLRDKGRNTVIVGTDPYLIAYTKAIGLMFPGRKTLVRETVEQATDWLLGQRGPRST